MIRKLFGWLLPSREAEPADARPAWMHDEQFMAWLQATKPGDFKIVTGFGPHAWADWQEGTWGGLDSLAGSTIERCQWRWEGWQGAMSSRGEGFFVSPVGPPKWWWNKTFVAWHDEKYPWAEGESAAEISLLLQKEPTRAEHSGPLYDAVKPARRRYQGWCGVLQLRSGRVVCPECGSWDVDNVDDTITAKCGHCGNEWHATWPPEANP